MNLHAASSKCQAAGSLVRTCTTYFCSCICMSPAGSSHLPTNLTASLACKQHLHQQLRQACGSMQAAVLAVPGARQLPAHGQDAGPLLQAAALCEEHRGVGAPPAQHGHHGCRLHPQLPPSCGTGLPLAVRTSTSQAAQAFHGHHCSDLRPHISLCLTRAVQATWGVRGLPLVLPTRHGPQPWDLDLSRPATWLTASLVALHAWLVLHVLLLPASAQPWRPILAYPSAHEVLLAADHGGPESDSPGCAQ